MKIQILAGIALVSITNLNAQSVSDSVEMSPGYVNESYYNLEGGEVANINNTTWDIAFDLSGFGASIRINEHTGTKLQAYPNGDNSDWATLDTAGITTWVELHNSEESWFTGAFDQTATNNFTDLGWAVYNTTTHAITGDSLHVITLSSGEMKKLRMEQLVGGVYTFTFADIDGGNEVTATVDKSLYSNKRFIYYSIQNETVVDRDPSPSSWDIVFTKYSAEIMPGTYYSVTGALVNDGVYVRRADGVDPSVANWSDFQQDSVINTIGYDWKSFNSTTFSYDLASDLSYFIQDLEGNLWHLTFTKFEGSSTGKIGFTKEKVEVADVEENSNISSFGIYPNPASDAINIVFNANVESTISIFNLNGTKLHEDLVENTGLNSRKIDVSALPAGIYFAQVNAGNSIEQLKFIVR